MQGVGPAEGTEFLEFKLLRGIPLVLGGCIITALALRTTERDDVSHFLTFA
jgi:hypothetical protein